MKVNVKSICLILAFFFMASIVIVISFFPVFTSGGWQGHDYISHINRMISTVKSLKEGGEGIYDFDYNLFPGYSWNIFYPPLNNMVLSIAYFASSSVNFSMRFDGLFIVFLSVAISFYSFSRVCDLKKSILLSLLFSCSIYAVSNVVVRTALPEALATCFIPLMYLGFLEKSRLKSISFLAISMTSMFVSNIPSFLCGVIIVFIICVMRPRVIFNVLLAAGVSVFLSLFYLAPLVYSIQSGDHVLMADTNWFYVMKECHTNFFDFISAKKIKSHNLLYNMRLGLGWPLSLLGLYCVFVRKKFDWLVILLVLMVLFIVTGVDYSFVKYPFDLFSKIQFSWRMISFVVAALCFIIATSNINNWLLLLVVLGTLVMNFHISVDKAKVNLSEENYYLPGKKDPYNDYIIKGALPYEGYQNGLICEFNGDKFVVQYKKQREKNGMIYTLQSYKFDYCILPVMAYKSLSIKNQKERIESNGFLVFNNEDKTGRAIVERSNIFKWTVILGRGVSLVSISFVLLCLLLKKYIYDK